MSLIQTQPGSRLAIPSRDFERLIAQGPTDVVTQAGSTLLIYPDSWTPQDVAAALGHTGAPEGGTAASDPPGVPPSA